MLAAIVVLAVADAAALVYLALPLRAGAAQPMQVQAEAEESYRTLSKSTVPLRGIDEKLKQAQKADAAFLRNRLPAHYSDVAEELGKLAASNHIRISSVAYKTDPAKLANTESLQMQAGLAGPYVDLVKFLNAVERDKMFFIIDGIGLGGQKASEVHLDVRLETYLRNQS
jgi:hypothetical protein